MARNVSNTPNRRQMTEDGSLKAEIRSPCSPRRSLGRVDLSRRSLTKAEVQDAARDTMILYFAVMALFVCLSKWLNQVKNSEDS